MKDPSGIEDPHCHSITHRSSITIMFNRCLIDDKTARMLAGSRLVIDSA